MSQLTDNLPPGYCCVSFIGRGGCGVVWKGTASGNVPVAIKIISRPDDHEERQREVRALEELKCLTHHFLIRTRAYFAETDRLIIVMDLADGSLRDQFKKFRDLGQKGIPEAELLLYFRESAEALDYLHSKGVLHRDIKPENILLVDGHVRLADFGVLRRQAQSTMSIVGTPHYMAPEVWLGHPTNKSDQYSLAYAYAELRTGRRPFSDGNSPSALMNDHFSTVPGLEDLPKVEQQVVLKALAKNGEERFATCSAFMNELETAIRADQARAAEVARLAEKSGENQWTCQPSQESPMSNAPAHGTSRTYRYSFAECFCVGLLLLGIVVSLIWVVCRTGSKPEQAQAESRFQDLLSRYYDARDDAEKQRNALSTAKEKFAQDLLVMEKKHTEERVVAETKQREILAAANRKHEEALAAATIKSSLDLKNALSAMDAKYKGELASVKIKQASELQDAKARLGDVKNALDAAERKYLTELKDALALAGEKSAKEFNAAAEKHMVELKAAAKKHTDELAAAKKQHAEELAKALADARMQHADELEVVLGNFRVSVTDAEAKLRAAQDEELRAKGNQEVADKALKLVDAEHAKTLAELVLAINKPVSAYHRSNAQDKMNWDKYCLECTRKALENLHKANQAHLASVSSHIAAATKVSTTVSAVTDSRRAVRQAEIEVEKFKKHAEDLRVTLKTE